MLGRKDYTQAELDNAKAAINQQLAAYKKLVKARWRSDRPEGRVRARRIRATALHHSLVNNAGELRGNNVIKYTPDESILKLDVGEPIRLNAAQLERLSNALFVEIESKFAQ